MRLAFEKLAPYYRPYRFRLALGMLALVLKDVFGVIQPLIIGIAIDSLVRNFDLQRLLVYAAALIGLSAIKGVCQYQMRVIIIGVSRDIEFDLRNDLFAKLVSLSGDFYARYRTGDIMARA